jgi:hypothetical protein
LEEAFCVGGHFLRGYEAVTIAVGLFEPDDQSVLAGGAAVKGLAHRADEKSPNPSLQPGTLLGRGRWSGRGLDEREEQWTEEHVATQALAGLAAK